MRVLVLGSLAESILSFRGPMLADMRAAGHEVFAAAPPPVTAVAERLAEMGIRFRPVRIDRTGMNPARDIAGFLDLVRLFRSVRPDLLFSYTVKPVVYGSLAATIAGVPHRASMITGLGHAFIDTSPRGRAVNLLVRALYMAGLATNEAVFFHNSDDLDQFVRERILLFPRRAHLMNGSGVELDRFAVQPPVTDPITFLLIGRLIAEKGTREFVDAARFLRARYPRARFQLLGPPDTNPSGIPLAVVREWDRAGEIEYLGETDDVRPFIGRASVIVLPSYHEGTPRSVLEGMAMGRPIVTTDVPGCRQTTEVGVTGFLVPVRDSRGLAGGMQRFLDDPALIATMGRAARERAEQLYDVRKVNAGVLRDLGLV